MTPTDMGRVTGESLLREHARALNAFMHYISTAPIEDLLDKFDIPGRDLEAWVHASGATVPTNSASCLRVLLQHLDALLENLAEVPDPEPSPAGAETVHPADVTVHHAIGWICAQRSRPGHLHLTTASAMRRYAADGPHGWVYFAAELAPGSAVPLEDAYQTARRRGAHLPDLPQRRTPKW